ncbi:Hsp70 family protein [Plantactinospora solaniradicis]|uniref:Hsp70 family protein n=1 Tax=Plantactinospora solaniradicis TaxID=1723736 RepID=A0ABW1KFZ4_9ACTN
MGAHDFRLGVDFGTSNTVAVLRWPDERVRPLLFDGSPLLPSAVFAGLDGRIAVGRNALHAGRAHPERFEPYPKRCIDDGTVLLGYAGTSSAEPAAVPVEELIAAVLRRVAEEASRAAGQSVPHAVLTFPAGWRQARRSILLTAANRVFPRVVLVPEPVAAASHFVALEGAAVQPGSSVMVYDLGAGTFDASVVRRTADGFEVLNTEGLSDAGGLDVDAAMMAYVGALYAVRDSAAWQRLGQPVAPADRRLSRALWDDIRVGKEILSESTSVLVHVPLFDDEVPFGREQVEQLAQPILARTVAVARSTLRGTGIDAADLAGLYLVGGASRIPLVATMLHRAFGIAPTTIEQPELAVAEGSLRAVSWPLAMDGELPGAASGTTAAATANATATAMTAAGAAAVQTAGAAPSTVAEGFSDGGTGTGAGTPGTTTPATTVAGASPGGAVAAAVVPTGAPGGTAPLGGTSPPVSTATLGSTASLGGAVSSRWRVARWAADTAGWRTRNRWVAAGVAFVAVAAVLALVPILGRGDGSLADGAGNGVRGGQVGNTPTPSASPTPAPTPSSAIDFCLVGTWRETSNTVDFGFQGVQVTMKASGAIRRHWPDGRGVTQFGKATTWTGRLNGRRYEVITGGTLKFKLRTGDGEMFGQNTGASGTIIGRINGRERWREPLRAAVGSSSYACSGDVLSISVDKRDIELRRVSRNPDAKV